MFFSFLDTVGNDSPITKVTSASGNPVYMYGFWSRRTVDVGPVWSDLDRDWAQSWPWFHIFTSANDTERFSGIGKQTWIQCFVKADDKIINALRELLLATELTLAILMIFEYMPYRYRNRQYPWAHNYTEHNGQRAIGQQVFLDPSSNREFKEKDGHFKQITMEDLIINKIRCLCKTPKMCSCSA